MNAQIHTQARGWAPRVLVMLFATLLVLTPWTDTAAAHGSIIDPATRNYGCWERWGSDHLNPDMEQEDPMCWQAWQDNPNAMWNWNGLYRNGVGGNFQQAVPSGTLCSGGHAEGGRYDSMDTPGPWKTTNISGSSFTMQFYDQASHGADFFRIYVTEQGYDPTTKALGWEDLELIDVTGSYAPTQDISIPVSGVTGRSGHHIVFTVWQASHMDQSYYFCSDVNFT